MRYRAVLHFAAIIAVLLITWGITINSPDIHEKARRVLGEIIFAATSAPVPKCGLSKICPPNHFALHIKSGAANVVGPRICFEGKIIIGHMLNNVGPGLNIAVINGEKGVVEKSGYLNMKIGSKYEILKYLNDIKPGRIVMVASFDDMTKKLTDEIREVFVRMGSTLIKSVRSRDNWVFVGRAGTGNRSSFEKQAVNDEKANMYEGWPMTVEVGGCFPRGADGQKP
ncbi:protein FAM3C [Scomber scombrus]|uniref:protein FAM3C n=1 Tax=Scomber scombrus TaxID=13677 RepID=UPI002DDA1D0D|nr:protein FAM3C [Scomber scombrus]